MTTFDSTTVFTLTGGYYGNSTTLFPGTAQLRSTSNNEHTYYIKDNTGSDLGSGHDFVIAYNSTDGWHVKDISPSGSNPNYFNIGSWPTTSTLTKVSVANADVVYAGSSTQEYWHFTFAGLGSGTTGTEEILVPNAAITGGTFVQSGFPAGDYGLSNFTYDYGSYTGPYQVFWTVSTATNSDQHTITGLSFGTFLLSNNVVGLASPQTLIYGASAVRKVHSNFW